MNRSTLTSDGLYRAFVVTTVTFSAVVLIVSIAITTSLSSPLTRYTPDPPPPSTLSTSTTIASTTVTSTTTTPLTSTTTAGTTTPAPLTLNITCPPNVMVELGSSLDPSMTAGSPVVLGGCGNPLVPVLSYNDSVQSMMRKRQRFTNAKSVPTPHVPPIHDATGMGMHISGSVHYESARSPSFSTTNAQVTGTFTLDDDTSGVLSSDPSVAVGMTHVLHAMNDASDGVRIYVSPDKTDLNNGRVYFTLRSLTIDANCSSNTTEGEAQVIWDQSAQRWIATERSGQTLCIYISNTSDPLLSGWRLISYYFGDVVPERMTLAVWGEYAYSFTLPSGRLCVLDRQETLSLAYDENTTLPSLFCALSFDYQTKVWTPLHAPVEAPPMATATASSNTLQGAAVFMRAVDDELELGATTPNNDQLAIEHWYNVNFTTATYQRIRYVIQIPDFRLNAGTIPTPTVYSLDPNVDRIMPRLQYRWLPLRAQQSIVGTFTVNADTSNIRSYWFELRWIAPSMFISPLWTFYQAGNISHSWLPSISMDAGGTIGLTYATGNGTVYPSLYFATRLGNDPLGEMRDPIVLHAGQVGSVLSSNMWGRRTASEVDPLNSRVFFAAGPRAIIMAPWQATLSRVRIQSEVIARNWTAFTFCPGESVSCTQLIEAE